MQNLQEAHLGTATALLQLMLSGITFQELPEDDTIGCSQRPRESQNIVGCKCSPGWTRGLGPIYSR
jgi:hypothetical protein